MSHLFVHMAAHGRLEHDRSPLFGVAPVVCPQWDSNPTL